MLFHRRAQFAAVLTPRAFGALVDAAAEHQGLVSKDDWLLGLLIEKMNDAEWARAGSVLIQRMLSTTFAPTSTAASALFAATKRALVIGLDGDARMPDLLASALRRTFFIECLVAERAEWVPILEFHVTDDIVPLALAAMVRYGAARRRGAASTELRSQLIKTLNRI